MFFDYLDEIIERNADQRTSRYYLMTSVWKPTILTILYLVFVHQIGPWYMKTRPPHNLRKLIMVYDIIQVFLNSYLFVQLIKCLHDIKPSMCMEVDYSDNVRGKRELALSYFYFWLKILDIFDTVFFILKKNFRQLTFLHIYHHAVMIMVSWFGVKFVGGGHTGWLGTFNTVVHSVMYSYYFVTAYRPAYKKNMTLKKFVTQTQLLQFILCFIFYGYPLISTCNYNKYLSGIFVFQSIIFLYLFGKFYVENYRKPRKDHNGKCLDS